MIILILLIIMLYVIGTPLIDKLFYDILDTNSKLTVEEFVEATVPYGYYYEYIIKGDYLIIQVYNESENLSQNLYAYKGKNSGFIQTFFPYGLSIRSKTYKKTVFIDGVNITCFLIRHRQNYLLTFSTFSENIVLTDNFGKELDSIKTKNNKEFVGLFNVENEEIKIYSLINDKQVLIIDSEMLIDLFK